MSAGRTAGPRWAPPWRETVPGYCGLGSDSWISTYLQGCCPRACPWRAHRTRHGRDVRLYQARSASPAGTTCLHAAVKRAEASDQVVTREQISRGDGLVLDTPKTKAGIRELPLAPDSELRAVLDAQLTPRVADAADAPLFPRAPRGMQYLHPNVLRKHFAKAIEAANAKLTAAGHPTVPKGFVWHGLRHSALTLIAGAGATTEELLTFGGHSDVRVASTRCVAASRRGSSRGPVWRATDQGPREGPRPPVPSDPGGRSAFASPLLTVHRSSQGPALRAPVRMEAGILSTGCLMRIFSCNSLIRRTWSYGERGRLAGCRIHRGDVARR